ncbi:MAG: alpha-mannosidase [Gemmatimonadales bacterium]
MSDPRIVFVVSHTHWDREWYRPFHSFRVDLVKVVSEVLDRLEDDDDFQHFVLDGQAVVLEDYLAVRPEDGERIRRLVQGGQLAIGPWYVLPDEFLVSGEATVRNLIVGHAVAGPFGPVQKVGYMPDSFGHIAQMPQILRRAGMDSFIYTRGNGAEIDEVGREFFWTAPDGSSVLAINQCGGYCNAAGLGFDEGWEANTQRTVSLDKAVRRVKQLFEKTDELSQGDVYLLNNGCDHLPPQRELGLILAALRRAFPNTEFRHARFEQYLSEVRAANFVKHEYEGELIGGKEHFVLSGVRSARMYLKQLNDRAQSVLTDYLEPLATYTHFVFGRPYPRGLINDSWKLLLQNHPHDSICGCSTDEVHREMVPRFEGVIQAGEQLIRDELVFLAPTFARAHEDDADTVICVVNPLPEVRTEVVDRLIVLRSPGVDMERVVLQDESGRLVPFEILDSRYVERFRGVEYRTELFGRRQHEQFQIYMANFGTRVASDHASRNEWDMFLHVRFLAEDLPGLGHLNFCLRETGRDRSDGSDPRTNAVIVGARTIENEFYVVTLHPDGTFDVRDKDTGHRFTGLNRLEDTADVGDEYDYSPCEDGNAVSTDGINGTVSIVDGGGLGGRIQVEFPLELPVGLAPDRRSRSETSLACRVRVRVGLKSADSVIEVETSFDNRVKDHRLRASFPTTVASDIVVSDGQFHVNERPVDQPSGSDWVQPPSGTYPQQEFTLQYDESRGLALFNRGLPEVRAVRDDSGASCLYLTLLRAVGWLSRDDFASRRHSNAGPTLPTPDAQCIGEHHFQYGVMPLAPGKDVAAVKCVSRRYRVPVVAVQGVKDGSIAGGTGLLHKSTTSTVIAAIKRHESRDSLVIRLYNLIERPVEETLTLGVDIRRAWRTNLLEERQRAIEITSPRQIDIHLGAHEILTVEVEPG